MGIRKLNKFLTENKLIKIYDNLADFVKNKRETRQKIVVAIDFWLYANKFLYSPKLDNILYGFLNQILKLLKHGIIPLYVIDGVMPNEKKSVINTTSDKPIMLDDILLNSDTTIVMGKSKKKNKKVDKCDMDNIFRLFESFGIICIRSQYEADGLSAKLYKKGIITSCLSDDMDMLALGCGSTIKFQNGKVIEYDLDHVKKELGIDQKQLVEMCILLGCDYLPHALRMCGEDIYKLIKEYGSFFDALISSNHDILNVNNVNVKTIGEGYYNVYNIYMNGNTLDEIPEELYDYNINVSIDDIIDIINNKKEYIYRLNSLAH